MDLVGASSILEIVLEAKDQASEKIKSLGEQIDESNKKTVNWSQALTISGGIITGVGLAGAGAMAMLADAASKQQDVQAQTEAVIKSTGDVSKVTSEEVENLADKFAKLTPFSANAVQQAENLILTFTDINKNVFPQTTQVILDVAQAMHEDLQSATIQIGKAMNDPATGMSMLHRIGVTFTQGQMDAAKAMEKTGNLAGAQAIVLKELQKEFGGSAEAAGQTFGGQMSILNNQLDIFKESLGKELLPALINLVKGINGIIEGFNSLNPATKQTIVFVLEFVTAFGLIAGPILTAIGLFGAVAAGAAAIGVALAPVLLILAAVAAAAVAVFYAFTHWSEIVSIAKGLWAVLVDFFTGGDVTATWYQHFGTSFMGVAKFMDNLRNTVQGLGAVIYDFFTGGDITATWNQWFGAVPKIIIDLDNFRDTIIYDIFPGIVAGISRFVSVVGTIFVTPFKLYFAAIKFELTLVWDYYVLIFSLIQNVLRIFATWFQATFGKQIQQAVTYIIGQVQLILNGWKLVFETIFSFTLSIWNDISGASKAGASAASSGIMAILTPLYGWFTKNVITPIEKAWSGFWDNMKSIISTIGNDIKNIAHDILSSIVGWINGLINNFNSLGSHVSGFQKLPTVGSFDQGGYVPATGIALVHQGEFVLSKAMLSGHTPIPNSVSNINSNNQTPININIANMSSDMDLNLLGSKLAFAVRNSR